MVTIAVEVDSRTALRAVEERVTLALHELTDLWQQVAGRRADVLGDRDLPWLIRNAAGGGKMIRPEMVHWGWVSAGAPEDRRAQVVELGAAIELLHLFALVHDDVMDRSELRRGQPTCHVLAREAHQRAGALGDAAGFGDAVAILAGDLLQSEADHMVAALPADVRGAWRLMMVELVLGQRRDLTGAALGRRDLAHAREVARLKSGSYTVLGPLRMGAMLGGADDRLLGCLGRFADHVGEAFGLRDDVLGVWGDPSRTGKSVKDDLAAGKATVLLALAHDRLSGSGRRLLARAGSGTLSDDQLARLRDEMCRCGVRELVEEMISDEVARACRELDPELVTQEGIDGLTDIAHRIAWRQS